jgi:cytoskeletal protein RodZ
MSSEFGKQFADARNSLGITLKDASEVTKIRLEYLASIENGNGDCVLPDIYMRGFAKIYAKYLKLDVDAVMASCPVKEFEVLNNAGAKGGKRISYNTIVANEKEQDDETDAGVNYSVPIAKKLKSLSESIKQLASHKHASEIVGVCVILLILAIAIPRIVRKSHHTKIPTEQVNQIFSAPEQKTLSLVANGNVKVVVRDKESGEKIFTGDLVAGAKKEISYGKPLQIFYDKGEFVSIDQRNGERIRLQPGRGGMEIK